MNRKGPRARGGLNNQLVSRALSEAGYEIVWLNGFAKWIRRRKGIKEAGEALAAHQWKLAEGLPELPVCGVQEVDSTEGQLDFEA